jgi:hypothetical protein
MQDINNDNPVLSDVEKEKPEMLDPFMTAQKLEEVKNIIEKPEERWRVLWHQPRLAESPPSPCGSSRSFNSSIGSWNNRTSIQVKKKLCNAYIHWHFEICSQSPCQHKKVSTKQKVVN